MNQANFDVILNYLSKTKGKNFFNEVHESLTNDKVCLHDLGEFEVVNVINIINDKIVLQKLGLKEHKIIGLESILEELKSVNENMIEQIQITNEFCGYVIFLKLNLGKLIGIYKNTSQNFENDILYQRELLLLGHPNKNIYLFDRGKLLGDLFDLGIL